MGGCIGCALGDSAGFGIQISINPAGNGVDTAGNGIGRDGCGSNGINRVGPSVSGGFDCLDRRLFAFVLISKFGVLCLGTQTGCLLEIRSANSNTGHLTLGVNARDDLHRAAISLHQDYADITLRFLSLEANVEFF